MFELACSALVSHSLCDAYPRWRASLVRDRSMFDVYPAAGRS